MNMEVYKFLIRLLVQKVISYFSYKMRKSQFVRQVMKDKRKNYSTKHFFHTNLFSDEEKSLPVSDDEHMEGQ